MMTDPPSVLHRKTIVHTASETQECVKLAQLCPTLGDPVECTVHGIPPGHNTGVGSTYDAPHHFQKGCYDFLLGAIPFRETHCIIISSSHHVGRGAL